jgi:membrane protease YdiL (CAAX protease family)
VSDSSLSRPKQISLFIFTIIFGFALFVIPDVFFGVTKINGGKIGINLLFMSLFQVITVSLFIKFSLKKTGKSFKDIGWDFSKWKKDSILGLVVGLSWTVLQFAWIIPATGGADRADVTHMISMMDGTIIGLLSYIALGVIGGGITEEIYNRGYFITEMKSMFQNPKTGIWTASVVSILFFCFGHLPADALGWLDILVPTAAYTILFVATGRLTASIVAHGVYNMTAILMVYFMYF